MMNQKMSLRELADMINDAYAKGLSVTVAGHKVKAFGRPASVWGTGSLSVSVVAKKPGRTNQIWFRPGQPVPDVTIEKA